MSYYKLFVGNLQWEITEEDLKLLFSGVASVVSVAIVMDRETGKSRGFGFVEMETESGAKEAIKKLDQKTFNGRRILVREAKPNPEADKGTNGIFGRISAFTRRSDVGDKFEFEENDKHFYVIRDA